MSGNKGYFTRKRAELGNQSIVDHYDEGKFVSLAWNQLIEAGSTVK